MIYQCITIFLLALHTGLQALLALSRLTVLPDLLGSARHFCKHLQTQKRQQPAYFTQHFSHATKQQLKWQNSSLLPQSNNWSYKTAPKFNCTTCPQYTLLMDINRSTLVYTYIHINIYTYIHIYIYTYIHIHVYTYIRI